MNNADETPTPEPTSDVPDGLPFTSNGFKDVEDRAWKEGRISEHVGEGWLEISVAGRMNSKRLPYLVFTLKGKRVSRDNAMRLIERSQEWQARRLLRRDYGVNQLAESICETFSKSSPGCSEAGSVSWPYVSESEKDQWRAVAKSIIDERTPSPEPNEGWTKVPADLPIELLKSINYDNQVLAYENGRYYNAWFEFEQSESGWFWTDEADSEPNPSHYRLLMEAPADV